MMMMARLGWLAVCLADLFSVVSFCSASTVEDYIKRDSNP